MRNIGIGADIENIDRFSKLDLEKDRNFLDKIYTQKEQRYCLSKSNPYPHFAARFTGKEAILKAINSLISKPSESISYNEIEILNNQYGVPRAKIKNKKLGKFNILITLAHCKDKAIAFAIVTQ